MSTLVQLPRKQKGTGSQKETEGTEKADMTAEILCVGTELLLGDIVNTNAQYLSKELASIGIEVHFQTVVGDNAERILSCVRTALGRADMVVLSGGLGPTKDDMTKERIADFFGKKLVRDRRAYDNMVQKAHEFGVFQITEGMKKQADVPEDSFILYNEAGTAPGCILEKDGKTAILLPGPPREMKPMFETAKREYLIPKAGGVILSVNIKMKKPGEAPAEIVGEAPVAERLDDLLESGEPTVATYAKEDGCLIRVTAKGTDREEALNKIIPVVVKIYLRFPDAIKKIYE